MFENLSNSEIVLNTIKNNEDRFLFKEIVGVEYKIDLDYDNDSKHYLILSFIYSNLDQSIEYLAKIKYTEVSELVLNKVNRIPIGGRLIVQDNKKNGWASNQRFHIHDDSGYGENDGFQYLNFYCSKMEATSIEPFARKIDLDSDEEV
ncbi:hypothetical protein ACWOFR_04730 [Carnobacterium gallinarum]|uniref:hypothetical protein n=1 Tax=Carnobacterium gallinarum TaxID=2749 RepID=UPI00068F1713|nr:hypothetical protein [Carnobacterium gallinarum]